MAVSSSSTFTHLVSYDVFLNFRGSDTRYGFTANLYNALENRGIKTFFDDKELKGGDEITPSLVKAIQESRIAIPIFSVDYASSSFCLDELVNIMDCNKANGRLVLPVFYNVDPSHVRYQIETYGEALTKHEAKFKNNKEKLKDNMERLQKWKMALKQAANLSGYHYKDGYEHKFIGKIIEEVSRRINRVLLDIADYPVGLESHVHEVNLLLDNGSNDEVHMVGIHGIGGSGKTTLALAIYNSIADHFEDLCFLENIRENSNKHGLEYLQSTLLCETVGGNDIKFTGVRRGISLIKQRLQRKKVLLILDDVDKDEQLQAIAGEPNWFGPGSRVIITTRDKHLLSLFKVEKTYEVKGLNKKDALLLLGWKAFRSEQVDPTYVDVLNRAVTYASGLPLALEVIGSNLYGKSIEEWDSALNQYAKIPNNKILEILKKSYDALEEEEKRVFLDIACCFKGYGLEEVNEILCAHHGDNMKHQINVLVDKSLIKIVCFSRYEMVTLHGLIEEMGKEIVRRESPEVGNRSRLWFYEDVVQVLRHRKGSNKIEIIFLQFPFSKKAEEVKWDGEAFEKMENLKTLIIKNGSFSKGPNHLPNSLRVLEWNKYPSKDLPSGFCPEKLVICNLSNSCLSLLGFLSRKGFESLTNLNFNGCNYLTEIPDLSCLECLETLSFRECEKLRMIHHSVGSLKKLKILDAEGCRKLRSFPPLKLASLEKLSVSYCLSLDSFPEILEEMAKMTDMKLEETSIKEFPCSIQNLNHLQSLHIRSSLHWNIDSSLIQRIVTMPKLTEITFYSMESSVMPEEDEGEEIVCSSNIQSITLEECRVDDEFFEALATWFPKVKELILRELDDYNNFIIIIPECIKQCLFLESLVLSYCLNFQEIKGIPPNLKHFEATDCPKMTDSCRSMLLKQERHQDGNTQFIVPYTPVPEWFEHQSKGTSLSFWFRDNLPQLVLCLAIPDHSMPEDPYFECSLLLFINGIKFSDPYFYIQIDHTYLFDLKMLTFHNKLNEALLEDEWNFAEVKCVDEREQIELSFENGIHVLKFEGRMQDIRFTDPRRERKLEDDLDSSESPNHQFLKNHRFLDMAVSGTQIVQQQHMDFWSYMWNQACSCFSFLLGPAMQSLDDNLDEDSRSLASTQIKGNTSEC